MKLKYTAVAKTIKEHLEPGLNVRLLQIMKQYSAILTIFFNDEAEYRAGKAASVRLEIFEYEIKGKGYLTGDVIKTNETVREYTLAPDDPICADTRWEPDLDPEDTVVDTGIWSIQSSIYEKDDILEWLIPELDRRKTITGCEKSVPGASRE